MKLIDNFKNSPIGLKLIILGFAFTLAYYLVKIFGSITLKNVICVVTSIIFFTGFLLRWEIVRSITRIFILISISGQIFVFAMVAMNLMPNINLQINLKTVIGFSFSITFLILMFYYLGRSEIKRLFSSNINKGEI